MSHENQIITTLNLHNNKYNLNFLQPCAANTASTSERKKRKKNGSKYKINLLACDSEHTKNDI